ncbi:class I SAM-dependent methyltransferase [Rhizobium sp. IMFF44]|uniref:class I SAM-dependent methyltransferase n=1 Tax=Rhizobium sp. IMFF44 TaxID=3342350 RepID=UPI0035BB28F9
MTSYKKIDACRLNGDANLISILNLGSQELTGVFPKTRQEAVTKGPLELVWCPSSGLVQLAHSYAAEEMYGDNYGYRSGLNQSMVDHLTRKINFLERRANLIAGDVVLDIGSNDATSLKAYKTAGVTKIGIDPTGNKFREYYSDDVKLVPDFFTAANFRSVSDRKAKIVTSIAMFYDLDDPISFARDIESILDDNGIWHFEQSYLPSMLRMTSYDTICHEHLEYYSLQSVQTILQAAGMKVVDVEMNAINGGSFAVTAAKASSTAKVNDAVIKWLMEQEHRMGLHTPRPYREFEERVFRHREDLTRLVRALVADGKKILGYGASTKGNVLLQFCGFTEADIPAIAEVNQEKFGRFTPGTHIPIVSEAEALEMQPDYYLVLPWHFKEGILRRETAFRERGGKFIFPFPEIEII